MSTLYAGEIYPGQSLGGNQAPLELASAGGPSADSGKLPLVAWAAFVVLLVTARLLWEMSD